MWWSQKSDQLSNVAERWSQTTRKLLMDMTIRRSPCDSGKNDFGGMVKVSQKLGWIPEPKLYIIILRSY